MIPLTLDELIAATGGEISGPTDAAGPYRAVFTDTRQPADGGVFVALVGERFNGHDFIPSAVDAGAALIIANAKAMVEPLEVPVLRVEDTGAALLSIGRAVRRRHPGTFVAVTGSVGKTTVKDMTKAALSAIGKVGATVGNFNNAIGVPLSLFALDGDEKFVVVELGMNAPGEIFELTTVVEPHVGVVTSAVEAHLEFFDSVDGIADAKAELFDAMPRYGVAVANADDTRVVSRAVLQAPGRLVTYARHQPSDVTAKNIVLTGGGLQYDLVINTSAGEMELSGLRLRGLGAHNASNAAAAIAVVAAMRIETDGDIPAEAAAALALGRKWRPGKHRLSLMEGYQGVYILDDCYNANPTSTRAAIDTLATVATNSPARCAVLGSMLELGSSASDLHRQIGAYAVTRASCQDVYATGPFAKDLVAGARSAGARHTIVADDAAELCEAVREFAAPERWILIKGSRGQRLERLLDALEAEPIASTTDDAGGA